LHKTKLYKLITSLSKSEFNQLEAFINSPFFLKRNKDPLKLYRAIKEYAPKFKVDKMTKAAIFEVVYPKVKYNDGKMRNLLSRTAKIVDSYLLYLTDEEDQFEKDKRLSEVYNKRNIESEFFNYSRRLLADLDTVQKKDTTYYFNRFSLEKEMYFHLKNDRKKSNELLKNTIFNFQNYIGLAQASIQLEINHKKQMFNHQIETPHVIISKEIIKDNLNLLFFNQINDLLIKKDEKLYIKIIADFEKNMDKLGAKESLDIYMSLQNFGASQSNKNFKLFAPPLFQVQKLGLANNFLFLNGILVPSSYLNIVMLGLKLGQNEWTNEFIKKYEHLLPKKNAHLIKQFSLCIFYFIVEDFKKVINITNSYRFNHIGINRTINAKSLQIRSLFHLLQADLSYYSLLLNKCAAFDKYINREKMLIKNRKIMYKKFTDKIRKMAHSIKNNKWDEQKKKAFKTEIRNDKEIRYQDWFLKILNYK